MFASLSQHHPHLLLTHFATNGLIKGINAQAGFDLCEDPKMHCRIIYIFGILKRINSQIRLALGRFDVVVVWSW